MKESFVVKLYSIQFIKNFYHIQTMMNDYSDDNKFLNITITALHSSNKLLRVLICLSSI